MHDDLVNIYFCLELGFIPNSTFVMYETPSTILYKDQYGYIDFEAEIILGDLFFIGGSIKTYIWRYGNFEFWPEKNGFLFETGFRYKLFELGFRHYCAHPVVPYQYQIKMNWEGAYQEVYLRIEGRL